MEKRWRGQLKLSLSLRLRYVYFFIFFRFCFSFISFLFVLFKLNLVRFVFVGIRWYIHALLVPALQNIAAVSLAYLLILFDIGVNGRLAEVESAHDFTVIAVIDLAP